jgi:hypothetical protein
MGHRVATEYTHTQSDPATTWTVAHNFAGYPIIDVYVDSGGELIRVLPTITFVDNNTATVDFAQPQSGFARCS